MLPPPRKVIFTRRPARARAGRRSRCRRAPSSRPRRSRLRGRRSCPSTACRAPSRRAQRARSSSRSARCGGAARRSRGRLGDRHQAAQPQRAAARRPPRASARDLRRRDAALARLAADVDLQAHLQRRQARGALLGQALRDLQRSTLCTQSKCSATGRVLLLWSGPMKCHSQARRSAQLRRSCRAPPARSSRRRRAGRRACAARDQRRAGSVLLTASSVTASGIAAGRARRGRAMRGLALLASCSAIVAIMP